jgi:hypothetical protein
VRGQDLAITGSAATLDALRWGEVDILVMASEYDPDPGWLCTACCALGIEVPETSLCPQCGESAVRSLNVREAPLRLSGQQECAVEVVKQSDALMALGSVGCLLRYGLDTRHKNADERETRKGMASRGDILRAEINDPRLEGWAE